MDFESPPTQNDKDLEKEAKYKAFEELFDYTLQNKGESVPVVEYNLTYPKEDFLKFLVENKNVLLHGSASQDLEVIEPRQANDKAKQSGNKNAVYGVTDPVLPIFYAIQNRKKLQGVVESGTETDEETGKLEYKFKIPKSAQETQPWANGIIYIFDKNQFHPEKVDNDKSSGEWTSDVPVKPLAKLEVGPEDFQYMDKVEYREEQAENIPREKSGFKHLKDGVKPIIATIERRDPNQFPKSNFEDLSNYNISFEHSNRDVDYYGSPQRLSEEGFKNAGTDSYVISPVDNLDKLSKEFFNCTGLIVTGQDKETGEDISFLSHQDPSYFLSGEQDKFINDLKEQLEELKTRSAEGTIDAVIVGGQYFKDKPESQNQYLQSIELLSKETRGILGFEPTVITGPKTVKIEMGRDDIFYDNKNRRLYILRPEVGNETTKSYAPSDINTQRGKW